MTLFREEAMAARGGRLEGEVALSVPWPWRVATLLLLALVIGVVAMLWLATTARVVRVVLIAQDNGTLVGTLPDTGLPVGACGTLDAAGEARRVCLSAREGGEVLGPRADGVLVPATAGRFVSVQPVVAGTRVEARFIIGRERLIDVLL